MKLQDYRDTFYEFSGKASDLSRQLAFAAIAIIWLFKKDVGGQPTIAPQLSWSGIFVVLSLVCDMLQYCTGAAIWRYFYRTKEKARISENAEITASVWYERPITFSFCRKDRFY